MKKFLNQKFYRLKFLQNFHSRFFENSSGTILIEFAFCVPVLILLLLYINDIIIIARTQDEMKRAAYCAVQLIQNVSKCRVDKKITKKDIQNIGRAWMIVIPFSKNIPIKSFFLETSLVFVEGTGDDKCKINWMLASTYERVNANSIQIHHDMSRYTPKQDLAPWGCCTVSPQHGKSGKIGTQEFTSTYLYPDLHIKEGEFKVILELAMEDETGDNTDKGKRTEKLLGLNILKKPMGTIIPHQNFVCFMTHVIFKPINGIFSTTEPPK